MVLPLCFRYLASGCTFSELHYTYLLGISTISKIVREVCCAIWTELRLECIPVPDKKMHINYKGYSSIVRMAVADAGYRFVYANVGSYGKECNSNVFLNCELWRSIINGTMDLPEPKCLPGTQNPELPYYSL